MRKASGSQKGSNKQKVKRKAVGLSNEANHRVMIGANVPTMLQRQGPYQPVRNQATNEY